jgi:DNA polymerase I-like protein with 3'-5' exonuclease and polymerase domains
MHQKRARDFAKKLSHTSLSCDYNIFGTKTGRLTTKKNSFPILTMDKKFRKVVTPSNDWFVSLDFNGAELRTFLALSEMEQPDFDVHDWNRQNVYGSVGTREEVKERFFAWLYNPRSKDNVAERVYDKGAVINKHWDGRAVKNPFNRTIPADAHHAMSYLIQSTCSDVVLRQMIKLDKCLENRESYVAFCVHDEVVLDVTDAECALINDLVEHFSNTPLGKFGVNVKYGKSYGDMREWKR